MSESRFEALVVDFGGVLTTPMQAAMVAFADDLGIELADLIRAALALYSGQEDALVHGFEIGAIDDEEFSRQFAGRLEAVCGKPIDPAGLVDRIFAGLEPEESMNAAVVAARKSGLKTALLSNSWGLSLYPRERFPDMFDVVIISGEVGLRKPDPAIYELAVKELGVPAEACLFVDDHPGHLSAAQEAGMTTILHRTPDATIPELESLLNVPLR
jgi:putative hydrolase of the HAD superfamily